MGEAAARLASMERARNFMVIDSEYYYFVEMRSAGAVVLPWIRLGRGQGTKVYLYFFLAALHAQITSKPAPAPAGSCRQRKQSFNDRAPSVDGLDDIHLDR
jgi:hypothetical protein